MKCCAQAMESPQQGGHLQAIDSAAWIETNGCKITTKFTLPRQRISFVQVS
jgi:hypothetical protein